jgi:uncharacterized membrane protein YdjX (TVP38/TMEM64 family)
MGMYGLSLLSLGVLIIGLIFSRHDITRPKTLTLLVCSLLVFLGLFFSVHHHFQNTCTILADESLTEIKELILSWGVAAPMMSIMLMTIQAVIAPLPAFLIAAANGLVFGVFWGTVISWVGALCGALVSFFISRLFIGSFSGKFLRHKKGYKYIDRMSSKYGFKVVLTARLLPFISFDFISYAAGLSTIKVHSFILATGIGMLPATIVYTVFGFEMEKLKEYSDRLFTFAIVAVLVLLLIWIVQGIVKHKGSATNNTINRKS